MTTSRLGMGAALAAGFALGLAAGCANFDTDLELFCQSRRCDAGAACCTGYSCQSGACVKSSDGGASCTPACSGATPYCGTDGRCHSCSGTQGCATGKVCDTTADGGFGACVTCTDREGCSGELCDTAANGGQGRCVRCTASAGCTSPARFCDTSVDGGACFECSPDAGSCTGGSPKCSATTRTCVTCEVNADCPNPAPICDPTLYQGRGGCGLCKGSAPTGCDAGAVCDTGSAIPSCVECVNNAQCAGKAAGNACHALNKKCVQCNDTVACTVAGQSCNIPLGACQVGGADAGYPPAVRMVVTNSNPTARLTAGVCSHALSIRTVDSTGADTPNFSGTFSPNGSGNATFYSDATCTTFQPMFALPPGAAQVAFYTRIPQSGVRTVTVLSNPPLPNDGGVTLTVDPAPAAYLTLGPAQANVAGSCLPLTLSAFDTLGNPSNVALQGIDLRSNSTQNQFFSGVGCSSALGIPVFLPTTASLQLSFRDTKAGAPLHTAEANGVDGGEVTHSLMPGPPQFYLTLTKNDVAPSVCSTNIQVGARDAYGNTSSYTGLISLSSTSSSGTGVFYQDGNCSSLIPGSYSLPNGLPSVISYKDGTSGVYTLSARGINPPLSSDAGTDVLRVVNATGPATVHFDTMSLSVVAGQCSSKVDVTLFNAQSMPASFPAAVGLQVTSPTAADLTAFSNSSCTASFSGWPASATSQSFYFRTTKAGMHDLRLTVDGTVTGSQLQTVIPGNAFRVAFYPPSTVIAGQCSPQVFGGVTDTYGNPTQLPVGATITVTSDKPTTTFSNQSNCAGAVNSYGLFVPTMTDRAPFYLMDTAAQTINLQGTATLYNTGYQLVTISPANCTPVGPNCQGAPACCNTKLSCNLVGDAGYRCCGTATIACATGSECCSGSCVPSGDAGGATFCQ